MIGIGLHPETELWVADHLNQVGGGCVTVSMRDGTVMSVQPSGAVETRPAGAAGAYERATVCGQMLVFCPEGGRVFTFPYVATVPNA